jgi:predicted esterase
MAPAEQAEALARTLEEAGAEVTAHWHDRGHAVDPAHLDAARSWLGVLRGARR